MSFLVAAIEHHARVLANAVKRALVEKCSGFSDYEAGDFLDETCLFCGKLRSERFCRPGVLHGGKYPDWMRDAEPLIFGRNGFGSAPNSGVAFCGCGHWLHPGNVCAACGCTHVRLPQTPTAGQRGESPIGDDSPTSSIGSPTFCRARHPRLGWVCTKPPGHRDQHGYAGVFWPNMPTDPSPTIIQTDPTPSVRGEDSPADSDIPPSPAGERPNWRTWAVPAICDVLANHTPDGSDIGIWCTPEWADFRDPDSAVHARHFTDWQDWRDHVSDLIAERLDTAWRAKKFGDAGFETGLDMGVSMASEFFPQHRTTQK